MGFIIVDTGTVPQTLKKVGPDMMTERLTIGWHSVVVAIAAGAAGALASAPNRRSNLVGVVVALALVPALAASAIGMKYDTPMVGRPGPVHHQYRGSHSLYVNASPETYPENITDLPLTLVHY